MSSPVYIAHFCRIEPVAPGQAEASQRCAGLQRPATRRDAVGPATCALSLDRHHSLTGRCLGSGESSGSAYEADSVRRRDERATVVHGSWCCPRRRAPA
jgi:hypothetical protein